jgi:hypothetical protein
LVETLVSDCWSNTHITKWKYTDEGVETFHYDGEFIFERYKRNKYGDEVEMATYSYGTPGKHYYSVAAKETRTTHKYKYSKEGNWIERLTTSNEKDSRSSLTERTIVYYE